MSTATLPKPTTKTVQNLLAKSSGERLIPHSELTARIAVKMARHSLLTIEGVLTDENPIIEVVYLAALLHDIGKCTTQFQKQLKANQEETNKLRFRHNEVGWAFLYEMLKTDNLRPDYRKMILEAVYWHHGISNKMCSYKNTDIKIAPEDHTQMINFIKTVLGEDYIALEERKTVSAPMYYYTNVFSDNGTGEENYNKQMLFVKACVISADRLASSIGSSNKRKTSDKALDELIENYNNRNTEVQVDITQHEYSGTKRFNNQIKIVEHVGRTTQINAPAGFGKTILGLLWNFKRGQKLIWVCPRNIIAESVYQAILEELNGFKITNLSVELYLAGETKEHNGIGKADFSSDIIITNIDNYLSPTVDNSNAARLYSIVNTDVIFDEFHELVGDEPLFACFVNIMRTRNRMTKANTLLLSATPTQMFFLWDNVGSKTKILPKAGKHYPAPHNKKYQINTFEVDADQNPFAKANNLGGNNLFIFNSIKNAQKFKRPLKAGIILHNEFEDCDKLQNKTELFKYYGKHSEQTGLKPNIIGTHILQASLDISAHTLYESVLSPEATLQRIGRCDRWGNNPVEPTINIMMYKNRGEIMMRNTLYAKQLTDLWYEHISTVNTQKLTLDEIYEVYHQFEVKYEKQLKKRVGDQYYDSLTNLSRVYPIKYGQAAKKTGIFSANSNKLRVVDHARSAFVIYKRDRRDKIGLRYTNPFNVTLRSTFAKDFNELDIAPSRIITTLKRIMTKLHKENDERFDYCDIINDKHLELSTIQQKSVKSNTPYIRRDKVYHREFGVVALSTLDELLKHKK